MPIYLVGTRVADETAQQSIEETLRRHMDRCARAMPGMWLVEGATSAKLIGTMLSSHLGSEDRLLVVRAGAEANWRNVEPAVETWLADSMTRTQ